MCKCIASFLEARNIVIPPAPPVKPKITQNSLESLEDYGDFGFDMDDPSFQQFLENTETEADQHHIPDQKASEVSSIVSLGSSNAMILIQLGNNADIRYLFTTILFLPLFPFGM